MRLSVMIQMTLSFGVIVASACSAGTPDRAGVSSFDSLQAQRTRLLGRVAREFDADTMWLTRIREGGTYTVEVRRALVDVQRPVAILASLLDVQERDGQCFAMFERSMGDVRSQNLYLELRCSPEQLAGLLAVPRARLFQLFAIAARVETVSRPQMTIDTQIENAEDPPGVSVEPGSADYFLARGQLLGWTAVNE